MSYTLTEAEQIARIITASMRNGSWALSTPRDFGEAIAESDWLAEVKAAARAEERADCERAIGTKLAECMVAGGGLYSVSFIDGLRAAARIVRSTP